MAAGPIVVVFALRYLALFTVGFGLATLLRAVPSVPGRAMGNAQMILGDALTVPMMLTVGAYYLQLPQEAGEPVANAALGARVVTPEELSDGPVA
ncbi:MAG: hypothetical protein AB7Y46_10885 [Armatimonadota bacterium]